MKRAKWTTLALIAALVIFAFAGGGCGADGKKTQNAVAKEKWARNRAAVQFGLARDQYTSGNFEPARKTVNEGLRIDPKHGPLRVLSARLAIEAGQLELAANELAKAREINPKDAEADYLSGVVYQRWQQPEKAIAFYTAAAEKKPDELAYVMARSEMMVAAGRQEEALRLLQEQVVYFEHSAAIRDAVGQLLVQFKKYDQAADVLRQASILDSKDLRIQEHLGCAQYLANRHRDAVETFQKLVKHEEYKKRADIYLALGQSQMEISKVREARQSFETATELDPQSASGWLALARAALHLNDVKRADLSLKRALNLDPSRSETRLMIGYCRLKQNKLEEALSNFQRASALDKNDTVSLCMIGHALQKLGRTQEAMKYYTQALRIKPGDEMAARLMASLDKD